MRTHKILREEERHRRRTFADAIAVLHEETDFKAGDRAEVRLGLLRLPTGDVVSLINIFFDSASHQKTFIVSLPAATRFRARPDGCFQVAQLDVIELNDATLEYDGTVLLSDGRRLRAIEIIPAQFPYEITNLEWRIIHHIIKMVGAEQRCYRHPGEVLVPALRQIALDQKLLDCGSLSELKIPLLKQIQGDFLDHNPDAKSLSQQKISDTLRKFGMRAERGTRRIQPTLASTV